MEGRPESDAVAATRMITGADVNYGALTRNLIAYLQTLSGFAVHYSRRVTGLRRVDGGRWRVDAVDTTNNAQTSFTAKFVFLGGGGGALPLLQKSGIPEARGYAGFPVSGIWLRCDDPAINKRHHAKVYGMADVGSPPMSVPHLPGHRRHPFDPVRALCGVFHQVSETRLVVRSVFHDSAGQYSADDGSRIA